MAESAGEVAAVGTEASGPRADGTRASSPFAMLARLALGLCLLAWVLASVEWSDLRGLRERVDGRWLLALLVVTPLNVALSAWKWRLLLAARGFRLGQRTLFGFYLLGQFFSHVLPTSVGGDVVRGVAVGQRIGDTRAAFASILVERLTGLSVLLGLTTLVLLVSPVARTSATMLVLVGVTLATYLVAMAAILDDRLLHVMQRLPGRFALAARALAPIAEFRTSLRVYREHPGALRAAFALSLLFHLGALFSAYAACRALGEQASPWTVVVATLLAQTVAVLPLSVGGIGLMEWAFVTIFAASGLPGAAGAATMLALRINGIVWSCLGYLAYLFLRRRGNPAAASVQRKPR